jgi:hypothetical protein
MIFKKIAITITPEQHTRLRAMAATTDRSVSSVIRQLIDGEMVQADPFASAPKRTGSPPACPRCEALGYRCSAHRDEIITKM